MPGTFYQLHSECRMLRRNKHTDMAGFAPGLRSQILPIRDFWGTISTSFFPMYGLGCQSVLFFVGVNRRSGHNDGHFKLIYQILGHVSLKGKMNIAVRM